MESEKLDADIESQEIEGKSVGSSGLISKHKSSTASRHNRRSPFNLRWIYGCNPRVGVINLNKKGSSEAFYAASNCGVIYNWKSNQMTILQGHSNYVTCIAADKLGKWLVTADSGPDNIVTVWDSETCIPNRTLFLPHGQLKTSKVALSSDAKYLLTLAYHDKAVLHWWIWSFGMDLPHAVAEIEMPREAIIAMDFNSANTMQFVMISKNDLYIGCVNKMTQDDVLDDKTADVYKMNVMKPDKILVNEMGVYTAFVCVPTTSQILVTTTGGCVAVYGYTRECNYNADSSNIEKLICVKIFKLDKHRINVIKYIDEVVVTGNRAGEIRFYDDQMKLLYWCHRVQVDCVREISFNITARSYDILNPKCNIFCECCEQAGPDINPFTGDVHHKLVQALIASDATTKSKPFVVRDFLIHTDNQGIGFVDFVTEKYTTILDYRKNCITAMSVHVDKPLYCLGYMDGNLELINFETHKIVARLDLRDHFKVVIPPKDDSMRSAYDITIPMLSVTHLKYSPSGMHLACGLNDGQLMFLDPTTIHLRTKKFVKDTKHAISHICYSCDSMTMATADIGKTVCVYSYNCDKEEWHFVGKHRAHYKDINTLIFTSEKNTDGCHKLFSFAQDRSMVEYDVGDSDESKEFLTVRSLDRVEQVAVPLCAIEWPVPAGTESELKTMLIATDEHKYKLVNYETAMTLATFLGPRYEDPVSKMIMITKKESGKETRYFIFATKKIIGLQLTPLDGNPFNHTGVLGHPKDIIIMNYRDDLETLFALGKKENCVSQWAADFKSVEITTTQGGGDLDPYYCLLDGGRYGWLFQEIRDLFYYIQILCQGTFSPAIRRVGDFIPIGSLPDIMRALGFFPSEFDVENMIVHAKFNVYGKEPETHIGFDDFVMLYLNHRPAFGDNISKIRSAFRNFSTNTGERMVISREEFIEILGTFGECFSKELTWYLLSILLGYNFDDRAVLQPEDFSFLPDEISFSDFVNNILGVQDMDMNMAEQHSVLSSMGSQQTGSTFTQSSEQ